MAVERDAICPHCGEARRCRANPGVALVCNGCGERFFAPPIDPTTGAPPAGPGVSAGGVTVERGRPVVVQTARPRARAGELEDDLPTDDDDGRPIGEPAPGEPITPPAPAPTPTGGRDGKTGDVKVLTEAGRRGGLAKYARSKVRGW